MNLLDLRGLGPQRTLVLVNGRRHVGGDTLSSGVSTDINTIPTDLIDRVDVVTGGNSAVYGSDAIAGVVNFVLKDHYQGLQVRGQGGISTYGDGGSYFVSALAGKNFADGRGNIAVNVEYARRDQAWGRPAHLASQIPLRTVDADPAGIPNGTDGVPDNILLRDFRSATFSNRGRSALERGRDRFTNLQRFQLRNLDRQLTPTAYNCPYIFQPNGTLVPQTGDQCRHRTQRRTSSAAMARISSTATRYR